MIFPFDEALRASFMKETELFVAQHHPRGSQPARSADGRSHVRQRAARRALRHSEGLRFAVPARHAHGSESARPARQGQHPDGHVVSQSHVGRAARQVDSREPAGNAAAAAAGRCAGAGGESERRQGAVAARADGAASVERGLRGVPRAHGSDRVRARELRWRRQVARRRRRHPHRCERPAAGRHRVQRARRADAVDGHANTARTSCGRSPRN